MVIVIIIFCLLVFLRFIVHFRKDVLSPLSLWYIFLIFFVCIRLMLLRVFRIEQTRWVCVTDANFSLALLWLLLLASLSSLCLEIGYKIGYSFPQRSSIHLSFSRGIGFLVSLIGVTAWLIYYAILGGGRYILSHFAMSKVVPGAGALLLIANIAWLGPMILLHSRTSRSKRFNTLLIVSLFLLISLLALLYGRFGPLVWGVFIVGCTYHYCRDSFKPLTATIYGVILVSVLVLFKAIRLSASWGKDFTSTIELLRFYSEHYLYLGGEQSITDMSLAVLIHREAFPIGMFWDRWLHWTIDLLPGFFFPKTYTSYTIGRHLYWWATGNIHINSGVPIFGFVSSYITGSVILTIIIYLILGIIAGYTYHKVLRSQLLGVVFYGSSVFLLLTFSRIGDFSAAIVQTLVLAGGIMFLLLFLSQLRRISYKSTI